MAWLGAAACAQPGQGNKYGDSLAWTVLQSIRYTEDNIRLVYKPVYNASILALEGKEIILPGYIVPLAETGLLSDFLFSYYPFQSCFFCGGAGPETVVRVKMLQPAIYTSQPVIISGTLRLNRQGDEQLFYILEESKVVK
jgi:hypothetical protein